MKKFTIEEGYDLEENEVFYYIHNNETNEDCGHYSTYENAEIALKIWF